MSKILIEICCGSADDVIEAAKGGADLVELNSNLFQGGLTPSIGALKTAKRHTAIPVMAMVRPRAGGFCYTDIEFEVACEDAKQLLANGADVLQTKTRAALTALLREQYPAGKDAGLLTEGLMELGETVCVPSGAPDCAACPLAALCRAHRSGTEARYPVKSPPKPRRIEERTILLLCCSGRWAIRRRADKGLLAGLWEFPSVEGWLSAEEAEAAARALGGRVLSCTPCASARHVFTHVEWHMRGWRIELEGESEGLVWRSAAEIRGSYSVPTALKAYLKQLD